MGRNEHTTWVIMLDPTCLMVCYAEQRAARSLLGERQGKKLKANFVFQLSNLQAESCHHPWTANEATILRNFFYLWPMSLWLSWSILLRNVLKWYGEGSDGQLLGPDKLSNALASAFMSGKWKRKRLSLWSHNKNIMGLLKGFVILDGVDILNKVQKHWTRSHESWF